jgi:Fe-S cluster assembly scaffold protein SufB
MINQLASSEIFKYSKELAYNNLNDIGNHRHETMQTSSSALILPATSINLQIHNGKLLTNLDALSSNLNVHEVKQQLTINVQGALSILNIKYTGHIGANVAFVIEHNCQIIEEVCTSGAQCTTTFEVASNTILSHYLLNINLLGANRYHAQININDNAQYTSHIVNIYCQTLQVLLNINLNGTQAHSINHILSYAHKTDNLDTLLAINHNNDYTTSQTLAHALAHEQATTAILGKIYVSKDIKQANAALQIKNLIGASTASCHSRPQLEIYSQDVKCSHGATSGKLSDEALYYMQSRGIAPDEAKQLLIGAFVGNIIDKLDIAELQQHLYFLLNLSSKI